ncbi:C-type lectin domain family 2 member D-like [Mauremys reevesii]|uniref:C-type lectin domain family 2 member D-like n=1 Tax=Mauremys reevesii TaxID=260615 RepID=UPI00193F517C|nr:C-type lectin domain family 2 member D-like [Mauremys reevesii]
MEPVDIGSQVPLRRGYRIGGSGHQRSGWWPEPPCNCKRRTVTLTVALAIVFLGLIIAVIVLAVLPSRRPPAALGPCCPDGWVGYQGKCYYFSEAEENWNNSQSNCSSLGASLAAIDTLQDLDFLLRYKDKPDHWIGLRRDPGQPWKWVNGTEFNHLFLITADGDCVYLNDENWVSSSQCTSERHWICSKPDAFTKAKEAAVEGGS